MKNGFIYVFIKYVVDKLKYLSAVEYFKAVGNALAEKKDPGNNYLYVSNAVDIFTVVKWALVVLLWSVNANGLLAAIVVWYLILFNLHTFIHYFLFKKEHEIDYDRSRKRFIKLTLAILFSNLCFAYLFNVVYSSNFSWPSNFHGVTQSILYSSSNSLAGNYDAVKPIGEIGSLLSMIQYFITFIFVGVLISKAMPVNSNQ